MLFRKCLAHQDGRNNPTPFIYLKDSLSIIDHAARNELALDRHGTEVFSEVTVIVSNLNEFC